MKLKEMLLLAESDHATVGNVKEILASLRITHSVTETKELLSELINAFEESTLDWTHENGKIIEQIVEISKKAVKSAKEEIQDLFNMMFASPKATVFLFSNPEVKNSIPAQIDFSVLERSARTYKHLLGRLNVNTLTSFK